jgi:hypothetical protein
VNNYRQVDHSGSGGCAHIQGRGQMPICPCAGPGDSMHFPLALLHCVNSPAAVPGVRACALESPDWSCSAPAATAVCACYAGAKKHIWTISGPVD